MRHQLPFATYGRSNRGVLAQIRFPGAGEWPLSGRMRTVRIDPISPVENVRSQRVTAAAANGSFLERGSDRR
jgi:hypothetical protein